MSVKLTSHYRAVSTDVSHANQRILSSLRAIGYPMKIHPVDLRFGAMKTYNFATRLLNRFYDLPPIDKACVHMPHTWTVNALRRSLTGTCRMLASVINAPK